MKPLERWSVWLATAAVALTGLVYAWMEYLLEPVESWAAINHPLQPLVLKLHILSAPVLVFALGMIAVRHVWRHLREAARAGRRSGWLMVLLAAPMIVTGYLLQAVTAEGWLFWLAVAHLAAGIGFAVGVLLHRVALPRAAGRPAGEDAEDGGQFRPAAAARESTAARSRSSVRMMRPHARVDAAP